MQKEMVIILMFIRDPSTEFSCVLISESDTTSYLGLTAFIWWHYFLNKVLNYYSFLLRELELFSPLGNYNLPAICI